ncbi:MAG: twin-arginine translocase subunit TatC [Candidatus Bathyarchaeota archaeon]|nr:twin-arginine translocase subunit TatC [Candidatus Bathyarchaeota archaeon]
MSSEIGNSFRDHVNELIKRSKVVLAVLAVSTIVMLVLPGNLNFLQNIDNYEPLVSIFLRSIRESILPAQARLIAIQLTDPLELYAIAAFIFSIIITFPVFAYEVYRFVDPALYSHEKKEMYTFVTVVFTIFVAGSVFGFFVLFPAFIWSMFPFFTAVGAELIFSLMDFYNILFFSIITSGLIFTFPAFFVLLVKHGVIRTEKFRKSRKWIYVSILILAMIISPGASPLGNVALFLPMIILFEAGLLVALRYEKKGVIPRKYFSKTCKFCDNPLKDDVVFCPRCQKSQA